MKFQCDRCKTRYAIADEKVRGKILKIRCKSCEAIITVRDLPVGNEPPRFAAEPAVGASSPAPVVSASGGKRPARAASQTINLSLSSPAMMAATAAESSKPIPAQPNLDEWYLSVDGKQEGPFPADEAQRRVARRPAGAEMFAWRDDFEEWLPVEEVPVLAVHLPRHTPPPAIVASLPVTAAKVAAAAAETPAPRDNDPFAGIPGAEPSASSSSDDNFDFNIGEASRLVKLPILPPPQATAPRSGESLPGMTASAPAPAVAASTEPRADTSLKLRIASLSTEIPLVDGAAGASGRDAPAAATRPRRRRISTPIIIAGVGSLALVSVVGLFFGRDPADVRRPASAETPDNVLVTNFYSKDNPLFGREAKPAEKPAAPEVEIVEPGSGDAEEKSKPRLPSFPKRTPIAAAEGQVKLDPVSQVDPPRMGSPAPPREKVDSFEADRADLEGPLTPDDVRRTYAANEVGLKRCYERSLKSDPAGNVSKMVVKITIAPGGNVSDIDVPDRMSDLGNCVANSIKAWHFRRSTGDFTTEFTVFFAKRG